MEVFENLKYKQIKVLLELLNGVKEKNIEIVERRFKYNSNNFEGAKRFLQELNILIIEPGIFFLKKEFQFSIDSGISDIFLKEKLLNEILSSKSELLMDINNYLEKFKLVHNNFEYKPKTKLRIKSSGVRNLLIELDFLEYQKKTGIYRINDNYLHLFEKFLSFKELSPKELDLINIKKAEIGYNAEIEVLKFEKRRLKKHPNLILEIEHTANKDVLAGYDILSWEFDNNNEVRTPRYIEVKAISLNDCNFYWSRNEIQKAQELEDRYYLYLLPHLGKKQFDLDNMIIIKNPIKRVFNNSKHWNKQIETYLFSKNTNNIL